MRRDITARTYKEKHQQQVEKLTVIGEMSTYLAHEIRNPIMAIGGFANALLRNERLEPRDREKLTIIADETRRLEHMLTNILNFSRPTNQTLGSADLNAVAREAVELMQVGYARPELVFDVVLDPHLPRAWARPRPSSMRGQPAQELHRGHGPRAAPSACAPPWPTTP
jgi:signal transduction histidine kinase